MTRLAEALRPAQGGARLSVWATPGASRDRIKGVVVDADDDARLGIHVRANPDKGAANKAVERVLAKTLGLPMRDVRITNGHTARRKIVMITAEYDTVLDALGTAIKGET